VALPFPLLRRLAAVSDTVLVGGGLAGGAAAIGLARRGIQAHLIERETAPRHKVCGEFLSAGTQRALAALGIDAAHLGGAPIDRVRLIAGHRSVETRLPFFGMGLTRRRLDAALLDEAARRGARVDRGVVVRAVDGGTVRTSAGDIVAGRLLLANGKHEIRGAHRAAADEDDAFIAFKTYWSLGARARGTLAGTIELMLFADGYAGIQMVEDDAANLCLLIRRSAFRRAGGDWPGLLAWLMRLPAFRARFGDARPLLDRPLTITGIPYGHVHRGPDTAYRLGDQAAVIPSFCGDGMGIALHSAALAAGCIADGAGADQYHAQLRADVAPVVRRAALFQRIGDAPWRQAAIVAALRLWPKGLSRLAQATRIDR
jgi:flavin-dependent dehydrogenase